MGRSLRTLPALVSASIVRAAFEGATTVMLPPEVSRRTSPATGEGRMAETDPPEVSAFSASADVAEAEFAAAALDFCVPDAVQHRDIAARSVDVQFTPAADDFDSAAAGVEIGCSVAILGRDVPAARVGVNITMDLPEIQIAAAGIDFDRAGQAVGGDVAAGSIEIDTESGRHLKGIARLGAGAPQQMPELRAERFVLVDGADDDLIAFCRNRDGTALKYSSSFSLEEASILRWASITTLSLSPGVTSIEPKSTSTTRVPPGLAARVSCVFSSVAEKAVRVVRLTSISVVSEVS